MSYDQSHLTLTRDDRLVLYSDGLVERRGNDLEMDLNRLLAAAEPADREPQALLSAILHTLAPSDADDIPTSFGDFNFMAVLPDGTVIQDSEPGVAKGGGAVERHINKTLTTCNLEETLTLAADDPESGLPAGTVLTFSTTVTVFITGR